MLLGALFFAINCIHSIDVKQFDLSPPYSNLSLTTSGPRNCTFKFVGVTLLRPQTNQPSQPGKTQSFNCIESVLDCVQSPSNSSDVSCSDPFATLWLNLSGVHFQGFVTQLSTESPANETSLRVCQREILNQDCNVDVSRSTDFHHRLFVNVKYKLTDHLDEDDCAGFRELYARELESCNQESKEERRELRTEVEVSWISILLLVCWFYPMAEVVGLAAYDMVLITAI